MLLAQLALGPHPPGRGIPRLCVEALDLGAQPLEIATRPRVLPIEAPGAIEALMSVAAPAVGNGGGRAAR